MASRVRTLFRPVRESYTNRSLARYAHSRSADENFSKCESTGFERATLAMRVGFVGASHLGQVYSAVTAAAGMEVVLVDETRTSIQELIQHPTVSEPELDVLWRATSPQRVCTTDMSECLRCDLVFLSLDVATNESGRSDTSAVERLAEQLLDVLGESTIPVVILSQLPPGTTRRIAAGRRHVAYQVETLVFGRAVERARNPERLIVGVCDTSTKMDARYESWLQTFRAPIHVMNYESAELTKISINLFLASSVSTTNSLAELARSISADWDDIAPALRADQRIGPHAYLTPGLGLAGGNIERDLATFTDLAKNFGVQGEVIDSFRRSSQYHRDWVIRQLDEISRQDLAQVAILGLAYKAHTASMKNSAALAVLQHLRGSNIRVHDPVARLVNMPSTVVQVASWQEAVRGSKALIVVTPWTEYARMDLVELRSLMDGNIVIDPHAVFDKHAVAATGLQWRSLRRNSQQ